MSNESNIKRAITWSALSQIINQSILLLINIILIKLLEPSDFGLYAIPFVVFSFFRMLQDFGYIDVMIKEKDDSLFSTIYWQLIINGIILTIIFVVVSFILGKLYSDEVKKISLYLAGGFLIGSISVGHDGMYRKNLDFKTTFIIEFISNLISGILGIILAYKGFGFFSLVYRHLAQVILNSILQVSLSKWQPNKTYHFNLLKPHFSFSFYNISEQIINYLSRNLDTLFIGKYIGSADLGIYDRAFKLFILPVQQISGTYSKVILPGMSNFEDYYKMIAYFKKLIKQVAIISLIAFTSLFLMSDLIVQYIFGEKWQPMIPILKVFCIYGFILVIQYVSYPIFLIKNKSKEYFKFSFLSKLIQVLIICTVIITSKDIYTTAYATVLSAICIFIFYLFLLKKEIE